MTTLMSRRDTLMKLVLLPRNDLAADQIFSPFSSLLHLKALEHPGLCHRDLFRFFRGFFVKCLPPLLTSSSLHGLSSEIVTGKRDLAVPVTRNRLYNLDSVVVDVGETNMSSYFDTAARVEEFGAVGLNFRFGSGDFFLCVYFLLLPRHAT